MTGKQLVNSINAEEGHWQLGVAALVPGAGAIAIGIGAASDTGWLAVAGGIVAGVGLFAHDVTRHMVIDYDFFRRFERANPESKAASSESSS